MPVYEYKCKRCGHEFELQVSLADPPKPPIRCSKPYPRTMPVNALTGEPMGNLDQTCGGECDKLISKSNFILKGGGWAKDGY